ncbi:MAG TPA: sugar phosphate nucleotidyltransferase, partial [Gemmatimonadales bacterium]|nr:sugar phosphate nucleotidyltransferase [Gemmatimonadales bacterium]
MRREAEGTSLSGAQQAAASAGLKSMIPDSRGRPFMEHIISGLADVGVTDVILVVAPGSSAIRDHFESRPPRRSTIRYAVQQEPLGTADALVAAEAAVAGRDFLAMNADNLYPEPAIRALLGLGEPGLVAFDRATLLSDGNIPAERVASFALLSIDGDGYLESLVEKPGPGTRSDLDGDWVSMNLWRFDSAIFTACREVPRSVRGEFELPQAVMWAVERGQRFRAVMLRAGVLDLSERGDVGAVAALLG